MHTLNEGRTSQLAAVTCWRIAYEGLATPEQLQRRASTFDWTPGASHAFRPNYLPDKIFVKTKLFQPNGSFIWGPHKDIDIPGSAAGVTTFTIMWRTSSFARLSQLRILSPPGTGCGWSTGRAS